MAGLVTVAAGFQIGFETGAENVEIVFVAQASFQIVERGGALKLTESDVEALFGAA